MRQLTFDEWVRRNRMDENEDCEECPHSPSSNIKGSCYKMGDDGLIECPKLTELLNEYHKVKIEEEKKLAKYKNQGDQLWKSQRQ